MLIPTSTPPNDVNSSLGHRPKWGAGGGPPLGVVNPPAPLWGAGSVWDHLAVFPDHLLFFALLLVALHLSAQF